MFLTEIVIESQQSPEVSMDPQVVHFAELVRGYVAWAEAPVVEPDKELSKAQLHVAQLYAAALLLPDLSGDGKAPEIAHGDWQRMFKRFGVMSFSYYAKCFNPHNIENENPVVANLDDDLADIWRDLKGGLILFDAGDVASAVWEWRFGFQSHWGRHAAAALHAMQCWEQS